MAERQVFLRDQLADDPSAFAAALAMLAAHADQTVAGPASVPTAGPDPSRPAAVGNYRILRILGEGGMGVVYLAEQDRPRRTVALKVIRPGLMTPAMLRRFEIEAQTLGRLQHPGIAQVFEAGTIDSSGLPQPYFAMEYVEGPSLNQFAGDHRLDTRARVHLLIRVCEAIQHAHQRGVIHRDLKSANILVGEDGQPKVLDFGVAKLTGHDKPQATLATDPGQLVGTLPYMSPEQIAGAPDDVDTRSDVYTLGVVLFELLTGSLPHEVSGQTVYDVSRTIVTRDAPRLSAVTPSLRGDLDIIVAKALAKERDHRYQSPAALADDLRRYLADEPIEARPATTFYQLRKFARRNRPLVAAGALAAALLVLGAAGVTWQAVEATRGRTLAERMRNSAEREAAIARQINALLTDTLQAADPDVSLGRDMTVVEALDRTAANIDSAELEPRVAASIRQTLAATYINLSRAAQAERQAVLALELCRTTTGSSSPESIDAMRMLANVYAEQSRFDEAEPLAREAVSLVEAAHGSNSAELVPPLVDLSRVLHEAGRIGESGAVLDRALRLGLDTRGERDIHTLFAMHNRASALKDEGRFDEAIAMFNRVLMLRRDVLGPSHTQTLSSMNNLAGTLQRAGRNDDALALFREVFDIRQRLLGPAHAATITTLSNIGVCLVALGRTEEAEAALRSALSGYIEVAGPAHTKTLVTMGNLAYLLEDRGELDEAEQMYRRIIDAREAAGNPLDPELLGIMNNLAMLIERRGEGERAATVFADVLDRARRALPPRHYLTAIFANNYGACLASLGDRAAAEPLLVESLAVLETTFGDQHPRVVRARERLDKCRAAAPITDSAR